MPKTVLFDFVRRRVLTPILDLLRQGVTPEKIALSISLGAALGVFPVLGATTLLCAAAAVAFRLNLPAIQLVNYLIYPLQLALLVPFMNAGAWLFGAEGTSLTASAILDMARHGVWHAVSSLWAVTVQAVMAWSIAAPVPALAAYLVLTALLKRRAGAAPVDRPAAEAAKEL